MKKLLSALAIFVLYTLYSIPVLALEAAYTYPIADSDAKSGDILVNLPKKGIVRADVTYDNHLFGVLTDEPLAVYKKSEPAPGEKAVLRTGDTVVNVTDFNGKISKGDYITSSPVVGKGMKATQSGYVIGIATSDFSSGAGVSDVQGRKVQNGTVAVALRIEFAELSTARSGFRLLETLNTAFFRNVQDPEKFSAVIRYIIAGIVVIIAFLIGFFAFTRSIARGIEAMGRNPLARRTIQISIGIQVGLTIATVVGALIIAFIIIRF